MDANAHLIRWRTIRRLVTCFLTGLAAIPGVPVHAATEGAEASAWGIRLEDASRLRGWETPGEFIDLRNGTYGFEVTDLVVPGQAGLDIEIVRSFDKRRLVVGEDRLLGLWDLEIPRVVTMGLPGSGAVGTGHCIYARNPLQDRVLGSNWWAGATLVVPHEDPKPLLIYHKQGAFPTSVDFVTTDNWTATCESATWIVRSPNGRKYTMDRVAVGTTGAVAYASRVADINGNWIEYDYTNYGDGYPERNQLILNAIRGNDGQLVSIESQYFTPGAPGSGPDRDWVISAIRHDGRQWTYSYGFCADVGVGTPVETCDREPLLLSVARPDGKTWQYRYHKRISYAVGPMGCCQRAFFFIYRATYPNGLVASYLLQEMPQQFFDAEPFNEKMWSLVEKSLSGPGLTTNRWKFWYQVPGYQGGLNGTAWGVPIIQTYVQGPDKIHYFETERGLAHSGSFGERSTNPDNWVKGLARLSAVLPYPAGTSAPTTAQVQQHVYDQWLVCVFSRTSACRSEFVVNNWQALSSLGRLASDTDSANHDHHLRQPRVLTKRVVYRDAGTYTTELKSYTALGLPQSILESQSGGPVRTTNLTWFQNATAWLVGLPATQSIVGEGSISWSYDSTGRPTRVDRFGLTEDYVWYSNGNLKSVSRNRDGTVVLLRDLSDYRLGIPQREQYPYGILRTRQVNVRGTIDWERSGRGYQQSVQYDVLNRPTLTTPPRGGAISTRWETELRHVTTRGNYRRQIDYDALGRPIRVEQRDLALGTTIVGAYQYDSVGRLAFESDPGLGSPSVYGRRYTYDGLDRLVSVTHTADNSTTGYEYLDGHLVRVTDPRGYRTTITTRSFGVPAGRAVMRVQQETVAGDTSKDIVTVVQRNLLDQPTSVSRGGYTKTIAYTSQKLPWRITEPETGVTELTYNSLGNLKTRRVGSSPLTSYVFDDLNRLAFIDYPGTTPDVSRILDQNGNVTHLYSGSSTRTMSYDENDNLVSSTLQIDGRTIAVRLAYDTNDAPSSLTYPDGEIVALAPNALGWPTRVGSYVTQASYHANGDFERLRHATALESYVELDARQRTTRVYGVRYGMKSHDVRYEYDASSNVTAVRDVLNPTYELTANYDGANRIVYANFPKYSPYFQWASYFTYDAAGNLTRKSSPPGNLYYSYDSATKRLQSTSGYRSYSFTYDVYGNATRNGTGTGFGSFAYDDASRLRSAAISGGKTLSYEYDGAHRRVRTIDSGRTTYSFYLGDQLLFEHNSTLGWLKQYYYLADRLVATKRKTGFAPDYRGGSSTVTHINTDPRGSVIAGTGSDGSVLWREAYEPFGGRLVKSAAADNTLWFTGREYDQGSGLAYHGARYYDPILGRFMSPDPVSWSGGKLDQFNRYAYANNNPLAYTDIDGELLQFIVYGVVKGAIASIATQAALISLGLQDEFSVKSVLIDAAFGGLTGGLAAPRAAAGIGTGVTRAYSVASGVSATSVVSQQVAPAGEATVSVARHVIPNAGGVVRRFEQVADRTYYRVYSENTIGKWLTAVPPRSSSWAQEALSLPPGNAATMIQEVRVPAGTLLERSRALPVPEWGRLRGGAEQFELLEEIPRANFGPGITLP